MKKSTMLIVLLGVLMFGLVGNLFGQNYIYSPTWNPNPSPNMLDIEVDVYAQTTLGFYAPAENNTFLADIYLTDANNNVIKSIWNVPVVDGKVSQLIDLTGLNYIGNGSIEIFQVGGNSWYDPFVDGFSWENMSGVSTISSEVYFGY